MNLKLRRLAIAFAMLSLNSCVAYEPVPVSSQPTVQQRFDRSWAAATGAMSDQGLTITSQDRGAGVMRGERGGTTITATLKTLADGSVQDCRHFGFLLSVLAADAVSQDILRRARSYRSTLSE